MAGTVANAKFKVTEEIADAAENSAIDHAIKMSHAINREEFADMPERNGFRAMLKEAFQSPFEVHFKTSSVSQ
ncbi:hypothetical protein LP7551_02028 [Roseibium album]|nr:hypothetical protein LP7551_02028 [Roseibium album]